MSRNISRGNLTEIKDILLESKKYLLIYLVLIIVAGISTISSANISHPKFELVTFVIVAVLGCLCILFYQANNDEKDLYKVAFVVIVCFGLVCSLIVPIACVSDEPEHFVRAEITSQGVLFPHWTGSDVGLTRTYDTNGHYMSNETQIGFKTIESSNFFSNDRGLTVFETTHDTDKINWTSIITPSAFEQNIFYGYFPQAIGILIAKLLDLNVIWMLWLGRIANLLCYAVLVSYAVKKTPCLKIPLLAVACIPIAMFQAASVSIDSMLFGLGILATAYFIYMYKSEPDSLENKEIIIFSAICLLFGLCKLPYLAFIFLLFLVPRKNFKDKNALIYIVLCIAAVSAIGLLWSRYSAPTIMHSWRSVHKMNMTMQTAYMTNHPSLFMNFLAKIFNDELPNLVNGLFNFFTPGPYPQYRDQYNLITLALQIFLVLVLIANPKNAKFDLKTRAGAFAIFLLVYFGTCFVQLLSWSYVGKTNLGISIRYFIPIIALIPIICGINRKCDTDFEFDKYAMVCIVGFLAAMVISFATKYY
ncbi:DUF2142 domain-containing protein [Methanobrevibacter sp. YE315]|uniref:DUF2142 domain-containing protein n=1 Tax=Methanobrevibacter sp. YE315 TaxID=1609968 RepID=UPI000AC750F4|nr:DUF2142 domain-containing protein [Methanobrevibacter sp. YE315]